MKVPKKAIKEIMKSETGIWRKKYDIATKWSSEYFVKDYWEKMTESKDIRNLDFEATVIRIFDLNSIDRLEAKQQAIHDCISFAGQKAGLNFLINEFTKEIQKIYPNLHCECNSSSIKIIDEDNNVLFKAKCKNYYSQINDSLTLKINIDSAKFTYGYYFKEKQNENLNKEFDMEK